MGRAVALAQEFLGIWALHLAIGLRKHTGPTGLRDFGENAGDEIASGTGIVLSVFIRFHPSQAFDLNPGLH
jgi:hypothetical protein